jgi:hypothetical protein
MNTMIRSAGVALAAAAALATSGTADATPATVAGQAGVLGNCTDILPGPGHINLCGNVTNHGSRSVKISTDWGRNQPWRHTATLRPGQDGPDIGVRDIDGYFVPAGCTYKIAFVRSVKGPVWIKVVDGQNVQITSTSC